MKSKIFSVILIVSLLFACSNEEVEGEDGLNPFYSETYIRFVSPAGTNVMDSLDMLHMKEKLCTLIDDTKIISISGTRMSDGEALEFHHSVWLWARPENSGRGEFPKEETLAYLKWNDYNPMNLDRHPYEYEEVYDLQITSPILFGSNVTHTLKWYSHIRGRIIKAYKCEVDGKEIDLSTDPFFTYESPYWTNKISVYVRGLVEIPCNQSRGRFY